MSAVLNLARRAGLAVAAVGIVNEFFLYDGKETELYIGLECYIILMTYITCS